MHVITQQKAGFSFLLIIVNDKHVTLRLDYILYSVEFVSSARILNFMFGCQVQCTVEKYCERVLDS